MNINDQIATALLKGESTTQLRIAFARAEEAAAIQRAAAIERENAAAAAAEAALDAAAGGFVRAAEIDLREMLASMTPPAFDDGAYDV